MGHDVRDEQLTGLHVVQAIGADQHVDARVRYWPIRSTASDTVPTRSVAKRLGIKTGTAILSIRRVYVTARNEPVNLTLLLTRTDRYRTSVRLRESAFIRP